MSALKLGRQRNCAAVLGSLLTAALIVTVHSDCRAPPRLQSAEPREQLTGTEVFRRGTRLQYICRPGFVRNYHAGNVLVCGSDGLWSGSKNICLPRPCPYPGEPENGRLILPEALTFGSTVNFTCNTGYRLIGHSEIQCGMRNKELAWDRDIPTCQAIPCAPPPEIENGQHTGMDKDSFSYGDSVTYRCDTAGRGQRPFSLLGEASIFCTTRDNLNGVWSSPAPECKVVTCQQPRVDNGKLLGGRQPYYSYGDSVAFECDFRYSLTGSGTSTCRDNEDWEPPLPLCQRSSCDDPPYVRNAVKARLAGNLFPVDTVVTYECEQGHQFSPGETSWNINCLPNFEWSQRPPPCQRIPCPDPHIPNGKPLNLWQVKDGYVYGDSLGVTCREGFAFKDHGSSVTLRCTSDGTWDPAVPECIPERRCPKPDIPHGKEVSRSESDYKVGTTVRLLCDEGYDLRGGALVTCGANLSWEPHLPFCDQVCGPPPAIPYGYHSDKYQSHFPYGAKVTYSCAEGLSLIGDESIYCTSDDGDSLAWSGPAPECRAVRCPKPMVERGRMTPQVFTFPYGQLLNFSCDEGFRLNSAAQSRCQADGTWDPPVPTCQPILCPQPRIPSGRLKSPLGSKTWYQTNETVTFECLRGYQFSDNGMMPLGDLGTATCLPDGSWTPLPKCKKEGDADVCEEVRYLKSTFECGVPVEEVKTLLEIQKLFLEIKKLKVELQNWNETGPL